MTTTPDRTRLAGLLPTQPGRGALRCPSCDVRVGGSAASALAAELAILWLTPDSARPGGIRETHHCRRCAPTGSVTDIACIICSDGPLLTAGLQGPDLHAWLCTHGWHQHPDGGWSCPECPHSTRRAAPARSYQRAAGARLTQQPGQEPPR